MNKGMTWQAERPNNMVESDKQALTKVEFGNRKNFNETEEDFVELGQRNKI